jgi:hypothetical protein
MGDAADDMLRTTDFFDYVMGGLFDTPAWREEIHRSFRDSDTFEKGTKTMATRAELERQVNALLNQATRLQEALEALDRYPEEPPAGTVISFKKRFSRYGTEYDYAAIRVTGSSDGTGSWYTTGPRSPKGYTWEALCDFMGGPELVPQVLQATRWKTIVGNA